MSTSGGTSGGGGTPSGPAGGDLSGTYPNPAVAKINGSPLGTTTSATTGQGLVWNGTAWVPITITATGTAGGDLSGTYPNPAVAQINGSPLGTTTGATTGQSLTWSGTAWVPSTVTATGTAGGDLSGTYPNPTVAKINGSSLGTTTSATTNQVIAWNGTAWAKAASPYLNTWNYNAAPSILAQTIQPEDGQNTASPTVGVETLVGILIQTPITATNLIVRLITVGATLTNSYLSLYNASGTLLSSTADQSSVWSGTTGLKTAALSVAQSLTAGIYYVGFLIGSAVTAPKFVTWGGYTDITNIGATAPSLGSLGSYNRSLSFGSGLTSPPSSPAGVTPIQNALVFYAAIT